jgi:alpha-L-rhamnosidase
MDGKQNASMNSFAHYSFGAVGEWMINDLAGIQSDGPGYDKIIIHPHPPTPGSNPDHPPINWVKAHYDSIHGRIESNWKQTKNNFELEVKIPANTTATVYLPADSADKITEGGKPLSDVVGVKFLRIEGYSAVLAVESGEYHFIAKLNR